MTDVHVELGDLGGAAAIFKPFGERIRMMIDPGRITETRAVEELRERLPHLDGVHVVRRLSDI